jgi:hypothetical protein
MGGGAAEGDGATARGGQGGVPFSMQCFWRRPSRHYSSQSDEKRHDMKKFALRPFCGVRLLSALILSTACGSLACADSKSAAQFMLKICSDAMDDFAKVTAVARDNLWVEAATTPSEKITSRSSWFVNHGDQRFYASIWLNSRDDAKLPPQKACAMIFPADAVNRDEFFNFVSSSLDLEHGLEVPGPKVRFESYELKSFRPKKIVLSIISLNNNGTVTVNSAQMRER